MVMQCCVVNCYEKKGKGPGSVTFHRFPKNKSRRNMWLRMINRGHFIPTDFTRICSKHFTEDCFIRKEFGSTWLKRDAVPTIFDFNNSRCSVLTKRKVSKKQSCNLPDSNIPYGAGMEGIIGLDSSVINHNSSEERLEISGDIFTADQLPQIESDEEYILP